MKQCQLKGETRGRVRADIGPTMQPRFLATWWGPTLPSSITSLPPFYETSVSGKNLHPNFYVLFEMAAEAKVLFFTKRGKIMLLRGATEGNSTSSLSPTLSWYGEKCHLYRL
jgi:hypothetical protein